jgi:Ca2+-binding EF-hand superfamily protein
MKKLTYRSGLVAFVAVCAITSSLNAAPVTQREKQACREDYRKFCKPYALGSDELRDCMNRVGRRLSHDCVEALIDAGEVSRAEVERRKHQRGNR